jgi:hypothetical protein
MLGRILFGMALATALALAVVCQSASIRSAGYRLQELREQLGEQRAELAIHRAHISKLKNPGRILRLAEWLGLELEERPVVAASAPLTDQSKARLLTVLPSGGPQPEHRGAPAPRRVAAIHQF